MLLAGLRGHPQGQHPVDALAPVGTVRGWSPDRARWIGAHQRLGDPRRRLDHVLAVIQHDQEAPGAHGRRHPLGGLRAGEREPEGHRNRGRHQPGIRQRRELGDPDAVRVARQALPRDLQSQPGLADTARPDQRHEPVDAEQLRHLRERGIPADQLRGRCRQVRRRRGLRQRCHRRGQELTKRVRGAVARPRFGPDGPRAQDLLVKLGGLGLGLDAKLALQRVGTELVLAGCRLPAPELRIQPH